MRTAKLMVDMSEVQKKVRDEEFVMAFARIEWLVMAMDIKINVNSP